MTNTKDLTWGGIAVRFLAALLLVYLTFNPTGFSWFHWTIKPMLDKASSPLGHRLLRDPLAHRHHLVVGTRSAGQHNACSERKGLRRLTPQRQRLELLSFGLA